MSRKSIQTILDYLAHQDITVTPHNHLRYAVGQTSTIPWSKAGFLPTTATLPPKSEYMSLASMAAVEQLQLDGELKLLDMCAAPGMKSLYAQTSHPHTKLYINDISEERLIRLKTLFKAHDIWAKRITKQEGQTLDRVYETASFDRIILDAPCSGEGVILGDDPNMLETWSPAKVKRLQQLQIKLLKTAWKLLKPDGRLVYATCTLNKNENERVIKKGLGITVKPEHITLSPDELKILSAGEARRILPSEYSIGFFYAVLDKSLLGDE